jgi:hypothetical protein
LAADEARFSRIADESRVSNGRCENPEWRNITEYGEISRNITTFSRNIPEHHKIYKSKPAERRDRSQSNGSHAPIYKHGRLKTYFIKKVMDLSHFEGK